MAIDPITGRLIGLGASAAIQGIAQLTDPNARANAQRRRDLLRRQRAGTLGLTDAERRAFSGEQLDALRTSATQGFQEFGRLEAATGGRQSAGDVERRRLQLTGQISEGARRVARDTEAASLQAARAQESELAALQAAQAQRRADVIGGIGGNLAEAATVLGRDAGAEPEFLRAAGAFGQPIANPQGFRDTLSSRGFSEQEIAVLENIAASDPEGLSGAIFRISQDPSNANPQLVQILQAHAARTLR